ncbi:hypothetical protein ACHAXT_004167 [Thalassiosira profunda]
MKNYSRIAAATLLLVRHNARAEVEVFPGPGILECNMGTCDFSTRPGLGCSDPCHTTHRNHMNMYDWAMEDVADVSGTYNFRGANGGAGNVCMYRHAERIESYYPEQHVTIEQGCIARCTGCTFSRTKEIVGPALLQCDEGRCTRYTTDENSDCGDAIEKASVSYGSLHTAVGGDNKVHILHGFERINTGNNKVRIPRGCNLDCSGCTFQPLDRQPAQPATQQHPSRLRQFVDSLFGS